MVRSLGGGHGGGHSSYSHSSHQSSYGYSHHHHHYYYHRRRGGGGGGGQGGCLAWVMAGVFVVLIGVFVGATIMLTYGIDALADDHELIAASQGRAATCVVVGAGAVKGGVFELRYRLDEEHCYSTSWQNVPYGPFTPEAHPVHSTIACYGAPPVRCRTLLVVYKVDEPSSYALGMTIGGVLFMVALLAACVYAWHWMRQKQRAGASSAAQAEDSTPAGPQQLASSSGGAQQPPPPPYEAAVTAWEMPAVIPVSGYGAAAM